MTNDTEKPSPGTVRAKVRPGRNYARRENGRKRIYGPGEWVELSAAEMADPVVGNTLVTSKQEAKEDAAAKEQAAAKVNPAAATMAAMKAAGRAALTQAKKAHALRAESEAKAQSELANSVRASK